MKFNKTHLYLFISFIEGGTVMAVELLGAKMVAPYYGTSLYVWTSILVTTLGGLALGYYAGGRLSQKKDSEKSLFRILFIGSILIVFMPFLAPGIMSTTDFLGVRMGSLVSVSIFLLPPLMLMGMVSPIIIQLISESVGAGKTSGNVYAVSTLGGIIFTLLFGFWLIPSIGIKASALLSAALLAIMCLVYFLNRKIFSPFIFIAVALMVLFILSHEKPTGKNIKIQYSKSGILGHYTVLDIYSGKIDSWGRKLLMNGITQTFTIVGQEPKSYWSYPHKIAAIAAIKPGNSKALLIGMGGGSIAYEFAQLGFDTDIVELDERVKYIAGKFFGFNQNEKSRIYIDDARHYINVCKKKYDLIAFDILQGESQPSHVFTTEGFNEVKRCLNPGGILIINFQGTFDDGNENSLGPRSIFKTLCNDGFKIDYYYNREEKNKVFDIVFFGSTETIDFKSQFEKAKNFRKGYDFNNLICSRPIDVSNGALILTDDKPILEILNSTIIVDWRASMMKEMKALMEKKFDIY